MFFPLWLLLLGGGCKRNKFTNPHPLLSRISSFCVVFSCSLSPVDISKGRRPADLHGMYRQKPLSFIRFWAPNSPKIWTFLCCHLLNPSHPLTWKNFFYLPLRCKLVWGAEKEGRSRNMSRCFESDCKFSTEYSGKAGVCRCRAAVHFSASVSDAGCITVQPFPFVFLLLWVSHTNGGRNTCGDSRNGKRKEGRIVFAAASHSPKLGDNPPALHLWGDRCRIFHSFSFLPL